MSTAAQIVYRSEHPDVLAHHASAQAGFDAWREKVNDFAAGWPGHTPLVSSYGHHGRRIVALTADDEVPEGWRVEKRTGNIVPDRRLKAGREIAEAMEGLRFDPGCFPGMPDLHVSNTDGKWYHPGLELIDGAVWATWACSEPPGDGWSKSKLDLTMWEPQKLSTYHLAVEAKEAA